MKLILYRFGFIYLFMISALVLLLSCSAPAEDNFTYPAAITDQLGRKVAIDKYPQRIISLAPSNTEILYALGLIDKIVAVTDYCDYPPEAKEKLTIGGFSTPNIEEIISLSPDLVLATARHEDKIIPQLESKGLTIIALNPKTINEVLEAILLIGRVTDKEEIAKRLVDGMEQRINTIIAKTAELTLEQRPKTFYVVWHDPLKTVGAATLQDELITKSGGINIADQLKDYANINLETVVSDNPEVIICGTGHGSGADETFLYIQTEPRLRDTEARLNGNLYFIDANITSRAGPRIIDALDIMASFIHPELFGKETAD